MPYWKEHIQNSLTTTPINQNEFLVEIAIEKSSQESPPQLVASPKIICSSGQPAILTVRSDEQVDYLYVQVKISEDGVQEGLQSTIFMKENNQVVLSQTLNLKINN